jgi:CheY-like chemotaxis protein
VLGNLELIQKYAPSDPRILRLVDGAMQGAERGAALTKRLLAFARRQELRPETVDVANLVDSMVEMLSRSLGPMIRITTAFHPDLAPARVDPNQLELALLNLAVNARDAMPAGGHLAIAARREPAGSANIPDGPGLARGDYVCIAVRDTGCGMDEATLKRATEPFFTTKGQGRGTGLGLSMVHGLVAQSGGAMRIESRPNRGTTVTLWLPVCERVEARRALSTGAPGAGKIRSCRVLVVDDDPIVMASTAAMLGDLGHAAIEAASGMRALEILREEPDIDIVVTDYAMPGMTGAELAARIEGLRPGLPVVIASGYAELPKEEVTLPRLAKPYHQHDLAMMIRDLVGRAPAAALSSLRAGEGQDGGRSGRGAVSTRSTIAGAAPR